MPSVHRISSEAEHAIAGARVSLADEARGAERHFVLALELAIGRDLEVNERSRHMRAERCRPERQQMKHRIVIVSEPRQMHQLAGRPVPDGDLLLVCLVHALQLAKPFCVQ